MIEGGRVMKHEVFAEGWLQGESVWGRPVDIEVMPDGSLLVSDDYAGAIYRIAYRGPNTGAASPGGTRPQRCDLTR